MRAKRIILLLAGTVVLGACSSQAERQADQLDNAAEQADPAAAAVMENEAEAIRNGETATEAGDAGSPAQAVLENAGAAQTETPPAPR